MALIAALQPCESTANGLALCSNKYFTISQMPIVSANYWNNVHGYNADDVRQDLEGMLNMRILGRNMAFLIKAIKAQKEATGLPEKEPHIFTNFIR